MLVPIESLPDSSKLWVFQSPTPISPSDENQIHTILKAFTSQWEAHGKPLQAGFEVREHHFILIAANDGTTGCSIDKLMHAIAEIEVQTNLVLQNNDLVALKNEGHYQFFPFTKMKEAAENQQITAETELINKAATQLGEIRANWLIKVGESWAKRYLLTTNTSAAS